MEIKIIEEKKNALFSRREVKVEIKVQVTPSKEETKKIIADKFKVDENLIRIRDILGKFGISLFTVRADIYDSVEEFNRIVKKTKQEIEAEKKILEEKKKAEEEKLKAIEEEKKAKEEVKEEVVAPEAEEKKEEVVEEKVKEEVKEEEKKE